MKFEKPKISYFLEKTLVLFVICSNCKTEDWKIFKEEEPIEIFKNLGLIKNIWLLKKHESRILIKKYRWNKELFSWRNKAKRIVELKAQESLYNSNLHWTISYFNFYNYWIYFNFSFYFFD